LYKLRFDNFLLNKNNDESANNTSNNDDKNDTLQPSSKSLCWDVTVVWPLQGVESKSLFWRRPRLRVLCFICNFVAVHLTSVQFILQPKLGRVYVSGISSCPVHPVFFSLNKSVQFSSVRFVYKCAPFIMELFCRSYGNANYRPQ